MCETKIKQNPFRKVAILEKDKSKWLPNGTSVIIDLTRQPTMHTKIVNDRKIEYYTISTNFGLVEVNPVQIMRISEAIDSILHNPDEQTLTFIL